MYGGARNRLLSSIPLPTLLVSSILRKSTVVDGNAVSITSFTINWHAADHRSSSAEAYLTPVANDRMNRLTLTEHTVTKITWANPGKHSFHCFPVLSFAPANRGGTRHTEKARRQVISSLLVPFGFPCSSSTLRYFGDSNSARIPSESLPLLDLKTCLRSIRCHSHEGEKGYSHVIEGTDAKMNDEGFQGGEIYSHVIEVTDAMSDEDGYDVGEEGGGGEEIIGNLPVLEPRVWRRPGTTDFHSSELEERVANFKKYDELDYETSVVNNNPLDQDVCTPIHRDNYAQICGPILVPTRSYVHVPEFTISPPYWSLWPHVIRLPYTNNK
ncbi:hypothetical protein K435DRAFT_873930 [Dendrothele bispora CBS 962.96]|uniref:Uncharacterized protein n=1 Tax=Dendrothele bispora (strain CBS 962.96) TaxID=1314807 RepID=A0A4S8KYZ9_DENBC|nr:hypothetical protein K435DRAFT_873930 [Dendrothele bispora CBS 962.96]